MRRHFLILTAGLLHGLGLYAASTDSYRVAVLPAWKNWGHVHDFDYAFKAAGYTWTNCVETAGQIDWLEKNLDQFDLLVAPPLFHYEKGKLADPGYTRPYNMDKLAPSIAKWIQNGGCFLGVDVNYPMAMEWYKKMDPLMDISASVDPKDMKTELMCNYFGPPVLENNDSMLYFPRGVEPGFMWGHMVIPPERLKDTAWRVIATCGHGKGFPTLVVRRWGKGIIVLSSTRAYVPELMQNIRVNQKFSQLGVTVTDSMMPDPLPGTNVFAFLCENAGDKPFAGELELTLVPRIPNPDKADSFIDDPKAKPLVFKQTDSAAPKSTHAFKLACRIPLRGPVRATMRFRTAGTDAVIFDRFLTLPELFAVSGPPYRGTVSVSRRFKDVTFTTHIYPDREDLSSCNVELAVKNAASNVVTKAAFPAAFGKTFHKVPLALNLPVGKYTIDGRIVQREGGKPVAAAEGVLDIMPDGPGHAAFDEDNTLIVEGEPFLTLGIYHPRDKKNSYDGFKDVANVGFNVVNIFGWMGVGKLDILRPVDAFCLWEQLPHRGPVMAMEQAWTLSYHPSALINYTIDEPAESQFAFVRQLDEAWRKYDPYHPTFLASYQPHHFRRNAEISDILGPDPYPYSKAKGDDSDIALVARRVELARAASDGVNPVFCVPQAFGGEPPYIWRNMGLQAIVHGAKGLIWYAWNEGNPKAGGMVYNDELVAEAERLIAQLKLLAPAILGDAENQPRLFTAAPGGEPVSDTILGSRNVSKKTPYDDAHTLHGMVCRDPKAKTRYLILVNTAKEPLKMDLPLPEAGEAAEIAGAFDDSVIKIEKGVAKVELGKFGSGIWYWDGPRPVMPRPMSDFAVRLLPARASGKTWVVAAAGGTHTNLQSAINAAKDGDVIRVAEGNWGAIVCDNKLIDIVATGDRAKTILTGNRGRAATLTQRHQGDMAFETNTLVRGFTIQNGDSPLDSFRPKFGGGAIGGTLIGCVVQNNKAKYGGGAAFANIFDCVFQRNNARINGGGASVCNISDSVFDGNSASFDGGAAEFSAVQGSILRNNTAGRRGGATSAGSVDGCRVIGNKAAECGGITRSATRNSIIARNAAKNGNGGIGATSPSFCTIAYNTIENGQGSGVGGTASECLIAYNTCKNDPMAKQITGYHNNYGRNLWFASATTNIPAKASTFTASAFVNAVGDNYQLTLAAPFIDTLRDVYISREKTDVYGNRRISGAGAEPGAAELPMGSQTIYTIDVAEDNPLTSTAVRSQALVAAAKEQPLPGIANDALVFDGACGARASATMSQNGASRWPKFRCEIEFRTRDGGPLFSIGPALSVSVTSKGRLNITSILGSRPAVTNVIESVESVRGAGFNRLVVETDRYGGTQAVVATLNGAPLPVKMPFGWNTPGFFDFGKDASPTLGSNNSVFFKGEVKSFKVTGLAD